MAGPGTQRAAAFADHVVSLRQRNPELWEEFVRALGAILYDIVHDGHGMECICHRTGPSLHNRRRDQQPGHQPS